MSKRFAIYTWCVAIIDVLIGAVFYVSHPAFAYSASWAYVFLFLGWKWWCAIFIAIGLGLAAAIGTGSSKLVRKVACFSVVALIMWAVEFALVLPAVIQGRPVSILGAVLVGGLAALELIYLGMPSSPFLDEIEGDRSSEYSIGRQVLFAQVVPAQAVQGNDLPTFVAAIVTGLALPLATIFVAYMTRRGDKRTARGNAIPDIIRVLEDRIKAQDDRIDALVGDRDAWRDMAWRQMQKSENETDDAFRAGKS